jgi:hypothetical protein
LSVAIRVKSASAPATERELGALRNLLGDSHPDWVGFLQDGNGGTPEPNELEVGEDNLLGVRTFFGAGEALQERLRLARVLPGNVLAIADDGCGNYLCLRLDGDQAVVFCDHELDEVTAVAASFTDFMAKLRPDPGSVKLEPGQVISAWIDPSLLERK